MADVKTINGIAVASVKTIKDIAIAGAKTFNGYTFATGGGGGGYSTLLFPNTTGSGSESSGTYTDGGSSNYKGRSDLQTSTIADAEVYFVYTGSAQDDVLVGFNEDGGFYGYSNIRIGAIGYAGSIYRDNNGSIADTLTAISAGEAIGLRYNHTTGVTTLHKISTGGVWGSVIYTYPLTPADIAVTTWKVYFQHIDPGTSILVKQSGLV